ncbi:MAG: hypothetical protein NT023_25290 [Armatimonadetes bacterium]|nr:hypothetical protein [Armatimonadota bacterium]
MLAKRKPKAIALEYTGQLAYPYIEVAKELGTPFYIMHSTDRKALSRIAQGKKPKLTQKMQDA